MSLKKSSHDDSGLSAELSDMSNGSSDSSSDQDAVKMLNPKTGIETTSVSVEAEDDEPNEVFDDRSYSLLTMISGKYGKALEKVLLAFFCIGYGAYFIGAIVVSALHKCDYKHDVLPLVYLTGFVLFVFSIWFVSTKFGSDISKITVPIGNFFDDQWHILRWFVSILPFIGIIVIIILSAYERVENLVSLIGWFFLIGLLFLCSNAPFKVKMRPVLCGFALQFYFAAIILKWNKGYNFFNAIGELFRQFLQFSEKGASFVLGNLDDHIFAFKVLPVIIFFSCVISVLYYVGFMSFVIGKIAFIMRITMGTTAAESLCAAGNIFVGQTEAPIMIRPFLSLMTRSELHAVMVGGFSTIAGAVLAAYIMKGVPATHLLTASVMNAPAALAVSKILYPELGKSRVTKIHQKIEEKMKYKNIIEAAAAGASASISLVANVAANLIAFVGLLYFIDSAISWFGAFVCLPQLNFQWICHYTLMPLTWMMGVEWKDAGTVAELIGVKTFLNEFFAYDKLSDMINNRVKCMDGLQISVRSEIISTYALCGFANLSSIGIQMGGLGQMAPNRVSDLAQIAVSALFGGVVNNLMTACVAGLLIVENPFETVSCFNATAATVTV